MEKEITFRELQAYLKKEEPYLVLEGKTKGKLVTEVKEKIQLGYKPVGGITIENGRYYQSMMIE